MAARTRRIAFVRGPGGRLVPYFHRKAATASVPSPGTLAFASAAYAVSEGDGPVTISVTRSGGTLGAVGVDVDVTGGDATAGSDYTDPGFPVTLSWSDGESGTKTIDLEILDDATEEGAETLVLGLSNPTGDATLGSPSSAEITIAASDAGGEPGEATTLLRLDPDRDARVGGSRRFNGVDSVLVARANLAATGGYFGFARFAPDALPAAGADAALLTLNASGSTRAAVVLRPDGRVALEHGGQSAVSPSVVALPSNLAVRLRPGSAQYLSVADNASLSLGADTGFLVAGWVWLDSKPANAYAIAAQSNTADNNRAWRLIFESTAGQGGAADRFKFNVSGTGSFNSADTVSADTYGSPPTGEWVHLAAYHDPANDLVGIAVNGGAWDTLPYSGGTFDSNAPLSFGCYFGSGAPSDLLDGRLDRWVFAKSPPGGVAAVADAFRDSTYNGGSGKSYAELAAQEKADWGLVSSWSMNELSGTRSDAHGANHLTAHGSPGIAVGVGSASVPQTVVFGYDGATLSCGLDGEDPGTAALAGATLEADEARIGCGGTATAVYSAPSRYLTGQIGTVGLWPTRAYSTTLRDAVLAADCRRDGLPPGMRTDGAWISLSGHREEPAYDRNGVLTRDGFAPPRWIYQGHPYYPEAAPPLSADAEVPDTFGWLTRLECRATGSSVDFAHDDPATCPSWAIGLDESGVVSGLAEGSFAEYGLTPGHIREIGWERLRFGPSSSGLVRDASGDPTPVLSGRADWVIGLPLALPVGSRAGTLWEEVGDDGSLAIEADADAAVAVVFRDAEGAETARVDLGPIHGRWPTAGAAARDTVAWPSSAGNEDVGIAVYTLSLPGGHALRTGDLFRLDNAGDASWAARRLVVSDCTATTLSFCLNSPRGGPATPPDPPLAEGAEVVGLGVYQGADGAGGDPHGGQRRERPAAPGVAVQRAGDTFRLLVRHREPAAEVVSAGAPTGPTTNVRAHLGAAPGGTAAGAEYCGAALEVLGGPLADAERDALMDRLGVRVFGRTGWGKDIVGVDLTESGLLPRRRTAQAEYESLFETPAGAVFRADDQVRNQCYGRATGVVHVRSVGDDAAVADEEYPHVLTVFSPIFDEAGVAQPRTPLLRLAMPPLLRRTTRGPDWQWGLVDPAGAASGGTGTPADPVLGQTTAVLFDRARPRTRIEYAPGVDHTSSGFTYEQNIAVGTRGRIDYPAQRTRFGPLVLAGVGGQEWALRLGSGQGITHHFGCERVTVRDVDAAGAATQLHASLGARPQVRCSWEGSLHADQTATHVIYLGGTDYGTSLSACYLDVAVSTHPEKSGYIIMLEIGPVLTGIRVADEGYVDGSNGSHAYRASCCEKANHFMWPARLAADDPYSLDQISQRHAVFFAAITDMDLTIRRMHLTSLEGPYRTGSYGVQMLRCRARSLEIPLGHDILTAMNTVTASGAVAAVSATPHFGENSWETAPRQAVGVGNRSPDAWYDRGYTTAPGEGDYRNTVAAGGSHGTLACPAVGLAAVWGDLVSVAAAGLPRGGDAAAPLSLSLWKRPAGGGAEEQVPGIGAHCGTVRLGEGAWELEFRVSDGTDSAAGGWSDPVEVA